MNAADRRMEIVSILVVMLQQGNWCKNLVSV